MHTIDLLLADWKTNPQTVYLVLGDEERLFLPSLSLEGSVKYIPRVHDFLREKLGVSLRPAPFLLWTEGEHTTLGIDATFLRIALQDDSGIARSVWMIEEEIYQSIPGASHKAFAVFFDILESRKKLINSMEEFF